MYKGLYCCLFENCEYGTQVRGNTYSHIHRVHLGAVFGCRFCPTLAWWQARSWSNHMDSMHPDQPKYEGVEFPAGPLEGIKVEPEVFVEQESFTIPVPKTKPTTKVDEPSAKRVKRKASGLLSYDEWEQAAKEGELYLLANSPNPNQPRPKAAAIRYRSKPSGGISAEPSTPLVTSTSTGPTTETPSTREPTFSVASQGEIDSLMAEGGEFVSTDTYDIES